MNFNRLFEDWEKSLSDPPLATVVLDRFVHRAEIIRITGRSYRLKDVAINDRVDTKKKTKNYNQTGKKGASEYSLPAWLVVAWFQRALWEVMLAASKFRATRAWTSAIKSRDDYLQKNLFELLLIRRYIK